MSETVRVKVCGLRSLENSRECIEAGVLRFPARRSMPERLALLHEDLARLLDELQPQVMAVEQLFSHYRHVRTSILMGHARGVVMMAGAARGIELDELAATEVKKATTGNGHATKRQIQLAVMAQLGLSEPPEPPDVADAIAIAMCAGRRLVERSISDPPRSPAAGTTPAR